MTRTIDERIEMLLDHLDGIPMQKNTLCRNMIRAAFAELWLDKPDGPGWWWRREASFTTVILITSADDLDEIPRLAGVKWQRVIGPQ